MRSGPRGDVWLGAAPDRAALEALFADDPEALEVLLYASIADVVERHVHDERLRTALHGQGVIGTFAGPRDTGTAWIHAHHSLGLIGGWSFVEGGIGRVSFLLADATRDAGAVIAVDASVAAINPGEGVVLDDGTEIRADVVVSNADPVRTLALLVAGGAGAPALESAVARWRTTSPVIKINCALVTAPDLLGCRRRPDGVPRAGGDRAQHRPHASVVRGRRARSARARVVRALLPDRGTTRRSRHRDTTR